MPDSTVTQYIIYIYINAHASSSLGVKIYYIPRLDDSNQTTTEADDVDCDIIITIYDV